MEEKRRRRVRTKWSGLWETSAGQRRVRTACANTAWCHLLKHCHPPISFTCLLNSTRRSSGLLRAAALQIKEKICVYVQIKCFLRMLFKALLSLSDTQNHQLCSSAEDLRFRKVKTPGAVRVYGTALLKQRVSAPSSRNTLQRITTNQPQH